ncbi:hypothetical protein VPNG_01770 [Cytospora leucostoma]|uniref:Uncharacterized protein n=1 Tax=Cytospora leucostoma TaxID=1230097 RepID=A0A423XIX7_9PEZI|nr:hypothetical protein VPNG_01770 [Cytospora leucostoma]
MPSVDVAMARSLRGGVWGSVARAMKSSFQARSVATDATSTMDKVKTAFSSWDNCMDA